MSKACLKLWKQLEKAKTTCIFKLYLCTVLTDYESVKTIYLRQQSIELVIISSGLKKPALQALKKEPKRMLVCMGFGKDDNSLYHPAHFPHDRTVETLAVRERRTSNTAPLPLYYMTVQ